jgi:tRNA (adenine37-N6)-methyltransferase
MSTHTLTAIGSVHSTRSQLEDDDWDRVTSYVELDSAQFDADALAGLDSFSHVEVLFVMHRVEPAKIERGARHPRNNLDWPKVGIFAQRGKNRPNLLGATICRVARVEGLRVHVIGLDALDGTPVVDLKPWVQQFGPRGELRQPDWMSELMREYFVKRA